MEVNEFNRRALIALKEHAGDSAWIDKMVRLLKFSQDKGTALSTKDQQDVYNTVQRNRNRIHDQLIKDEAAIRAKGYS